MENGILCVCVISSMWQAGGDCQGRGYFKYEIIVQAEWQNLVINEEKGKKKKSMIFLGKTMSDLWEETGEFLIFLLWHIVQVRNLVPKLFMVRVQLL